LDVEVIAIYRNLSAKANYACPGLATGGFTCNNQARSSKREEQRYQR
jgi:hypothetical protein